LQGQGAAAQEVAERMALVVEEKATLEERAGVLSRQVEERGTEA